MGKTESYPCPLPTRGPHREDSVLPMPPRQVPGNRTFSPGVCIRMTTGRVAGGSDSVMRRVHRETTGTVSDRPSGSEGQFAGATKWSDPLTLASSDDVRAGWKACTTISGGGAYG